MSTEIAVTLVAYCQRHGLLPTETDALVCELMDLCGLSREEIEEFLEV